MIVLIRWATVIQVASLNSVRIVFWMAASVSASTLFRTNASQKWWDQQNPNTSKVGEIQTYLAVASSIMTILAPLKRERPITSSCLCPTEKFIPPSATVSSKSAMQAISKFDKLVVDFLDANSPTRSRVSCRVSSLYSSKGSRFVRTVPEKRLQHKRSRYVRDELARSQSQWDAKFRLHRILGNNCHCFS